MYVYVVGVAYVADSDVSKHCGCRVGSSGQWSCRAGGTYCVYVIVGCCDCCIRGGDAAFHGLLLGGGASTYLTDGIVGGRRRCVIFSILFLYFRHSTFLAVCAPSQLTHLMTGCLMQSLVVCLPAYLRHLGSSVQFAVAWPHACQR